MNIAASGSQISKLQPVGKTRSYEQIVTQIEDMIRGGHFQIGDKMPSERAIRAARGVPATSTTSPPADVSSR